MKERIKQILSRNAVAIFFSLVIIAVIIYQDVTNAELSNLYIVLPALFILGEVIRQLINRR
jgi:hypothetical protein